VSSLTELPVLPAAETPPAPARDAAWLSAARRARLLSYFSLVWMLAEGVVGLIAGAETHSIGVIAWAIGSAVEAAAAVIVIVRLTGRNQFSESAEQTAQKWVAGSFFVLVPYILFESIVKLVHGSQPQRNWLAVGLLASSIVLMPVLGRAKHRLGERLGSGATTGGAVGLVGLLLASAGAGFLDPVAALIIAGIAAKEGAGLWRGDDCGCHTMPGLESTAAMCTDETCECC
jgi:divalent metal cation (Fe/Co/Zn/Cd) transporter